MNKFPKIHNYFVIGITILFFIVRALLSNTNYFFFDEGAAWYVSYFESFSSILLGRYTNVGDLPFFYLLAKPFAFLQSKEILKGLILLISVSTILVYYQISILIFKKKIYRYVSMVLLTLSPAFMYYGQEFKSYLLGALLQLTVILLYVYIQKQELPNGKYHVSFLVILFFATFTSFSTSFMYVGLLSESFLRIRAGINTQYQWKMVKHLSIMYLLFLVWFFPFIISNESSAMLENYVGYNVSFNYLLDKQIVTTLGNLLSFFPHWIFINSEKTMRLFFNYLVPVSFILISPILTALIYETLHNYAGKYFKKVDREISGISTLKHFFVIFLLGSLGFSILFFNVFLTRLTLLLSLLFPILVVHYLSKAISYKKQTLAKVSIVIYFCTLLALLTYANYVYISLKKIEVNQGVSFLLENIKPESCLVFTHAIASNIFYFYSHTTPVRSQHKNDAIFLLNYNNSENFNITVSNLNNKVVRDGECNQLIVFEYYAYWPKDSGTELFMKLLDLYSLDRSFISGSTFKVTHYLKK